MATRHHHTTNGGIGNRRAGRNAGFQEKMRQMRLPLVPLVQMSTGAVHPEFPATLLNFWLLTEAQLDDLARFYHQKTPSPWSASYPCPITWKSGLTLEEKRRKIGKFIGLRYVEFDYTRDVVYYDPRTGCDTPIRIRIKTEEQIMEEARQARLAEDDEAMRRKMPWYS
ncbi:unnamed protein product [Colletotrichum noveboracense]|uniref:Uncharacterized protein n=1 Tax=Colletotrichum noveboracense TaxID=2664923 RepID=A0A9W4WBE3_9PEZI|nr:unnamed protein product [Colletotrichum noveboracense]